MAAKQTPPLFVKLSGAGVMLGEPSPYLSGDTVKVTLFGSEDRARSERYVEIEAQLDRQQLMNLARSIWQFIDSEDRKLEDMRKTMRRQ